MTSLAKCPTHGAWRRASSILVIGPNKHGHPAVLTVKRNTKATFMPNNIVFPGGLCETADFSLSWLEAHPELKRFTVNPHATYPNIFVNDSTPESAQPEELSPHIGFRISAIRELVEEAGLMIDKTSGKAQTIPHSLREEIHKDPEKFCEITKSLNMSPDICALHDWSTWLTPVGLKGSSRRYDTQFYVVTVDNIEDLKPSSDNSEVTTVEFWDVMEILKASLTGAVMVAPVQMYELARLLNLNSMNAIKEYAQSRNRLGTERHFPVTIKCSDGHIRALPGDSLYPECPDLINGSDSTVDKTVEEYMKLHPKHHCILQVKGQPPGLHINVDLNLQQMPPLAVLSPYSHL